MEYLKKTEWNEYYLTLIKLNNEKIWQYYRFLNDDSFCGNYEEISSKELSEINCLLPVSNKLEIRKNVEHMMKLYCILHTLNLWFGRDSQKQSLTTKMKCLDTNLDKIHSNIYQKC